MWKPLFKAFAQLGDPKIMWVVWVSALLAIAALVALSILLRSLFVGIEQFNWGWVNTLIEALGFINIIFLTFLVFPSLTALISGLFLEIVARGVEARHYADLPLPRQQGYGEIIPNLLSFTGLIVLLNLVALPFYLIPVVALLVSWVLNGYLLGREYFELVAQRRIDPAEMREMRRANSGNIFWGGVILALLMTLPVINLVMPVVATAFFTHVYHDLRQERPAAAPVHA